MLHAADDKSFEFKPGDRIVFIGDALIERDIYHNYLETMLSVRLHGQGVTFRNAGWAGDTVWGESRAVFGTQKDGYNSLIKIVNETRPSVAVLNYGFNESFASKDGLAHFEEGYNALLDNVLNPAKDVEFVAAPPAQAKKSPRPERCAGRQQARRAAGPTSDLDFAHCVPNGRRASGGAKSAGE